ncbi:S8 family serine peptidase [Anaeromicrobium sediminis]|nr:S8 family serine peptidase [Anaeromicrobium sediminis]
MKNPHNNSFELLNLSGRKAYWSQGFKGENVKVAVIDTGILIDHEQFKDVKITEKSMLDDKVEPNYHGTAVASLIAGKDLGVAPSCELLSIEIKDSVGDPHLDKIAKAIIYAVDEGCDLINISYSHYANYGGVEEAIEYAEANNVLIICSSGNDGSEGKRYPAAFDETISVGGVNYDYEKIKWVTYGSTLDVCQVCENVLAAHSISSNEYALMSGTSFSTPIVTGIAALLVCKHKYFNNGKKIPVNILRYMLKNQFVKDLSIKGKDKLYGYGFCTLQPLSLILEFKIDSMEMKQNGEVIKMEEPAKIENGRTLVPLKYANDGATVLWMQEERKVKIMY